MFTTLNVMTTQKYCSDCNINFTSHDEFQEHLSRFHAIARVTNRKPTCPVCQSIFKRSEHVKRHMLSRHSNFEKCPATGCSRHLESQDLASHLTDHTIGTTFNCRHCNEEFQTYITLQQHESTHHLVPRQETKHVCPQCFESYTRKDHMLRHIRSKHTEERVVCEYCNKKYRRKDHMLRHVREQHREVFVID